VTLHRFTGDAISTEEIARILRGDLPDSRTKTPQFFQGPLGWMERVWCANCGADGGGVLAEFTAHVFYICDSCADQHAPDEPKVPADVEEILRG
jgi:hypothetical protein